MKKTGKILFAVGVTILGMLVVFALLLLATLVQGNESLLLMTISPRVAEGIAAVTVFGGILLVTGAAMSKP